jgi:hypothetical protein
MALGIQEYKSYQSEASMTSKQFFTEFVVYFFFMFVVNLIVTYLWNLIFKGAGAIDWPRSIVFPVIWAVLLPLANAYLIKGKNK